MFEPPKHPTPVEILMVEDNPGDVKLCLLALKNAKVRNNLSVVTDGAEALAYLRRSGNYVNVSKPDLILLDLNLPKIDGRTVLEEIKKDPELRRIPVIVLTTSTAEEDILRSYDLNANCYISKPVDFNQMIRIVKAIEDFWFNIVRLPLSG